MTALSLVYPVQNFINAAAIGFGVVSTRWCPFIWGRGKGKGRKCGRTGLLCCLVHGGAGSDFLLFMPHFLAMFTDDEQVKALAMRYVWITFFVCAGHYGRTVF